MTHKHSVEYSKMEEQEHEMLAESIKHVKRIAENRPCIIIIGFQFSDGLKVASVANISPENQIEMLHILTEGCEAPPDGTTFN